MMASEAEKERRRSAIGRVLQYANQQGWSMEHLGKRTGVDPDRLYEYSHKGTIPSGKRWRMVCLVDAHLRQHGTFPTLEQLGQMVEHQQGAPVMEPIHRMNSPRPNAAGNLELETAFALMVKTLPDSTLIAFSRAAQLEIGRRFSS